MSNLRKVAQRAGVSAATVSRVFSRPEVVSEHTRARVMAAAGELGWRPSQTARSLALGKTGNIALVFPDMANPIFGEALKSGHAHARAHGFAIFSVHSDGSTQTERELVSAVAEKADGIVLVAPRMSQGHIEELQRLRPVALVNRSFPDIPGAIVPSADGMTALVRHLADAGHTDIAYLAGPSFSTVSQCRLDAFRATTSKLGLTGRVLGEITQNYRAAGAAATDEVLASPSTAAIGYNDLVAVGLISELHRRRIGVGIDLAVAGFDGSWLCEAMSPSLTSVEIPFSQAVEYALDDVISGVNGKLRTETRQLASRLVVRESTRRSLLGGNRPAGGP